MAKRKATITVDPEKLGEARRLSGAGSNSETIDRALGALIRRERLRQDVAAYAGQPQTREEIALTEQVPDWDGLQDDTDWDALYSRGGR